MMQNNEPLVMVPLKFLSIEQMTILHKQYNIKSIPSCISDRSRPEWPPHQLAERSTGGGIPENAEPDVGCSWQPVPALPPIPHTPGPGTTTASLAHVGIRDGSSRRALKSPGAS